jgi:hypothetical protein
LLVFGIARGFIHPSQHDKWQYTFSSFRLLVLGQLCAYRMQFELVERNGGVRQRELWAVIPRRSCRTCT